MAGRNSITGSVLPRGLADFRRKGKKQGATEPSAPAGNINSAPMGNSENRPLMPGETQEEAVREHERKIKLLFVLTLGFKISCLILDACVLGFAAESTPNIDIFDCRYDHRPGFAAFFIVVHAFFFLIMIFLMAYQLFYQLKEKAMVPQRVMDMFCMVIIIIVHSIAIACYAIWMDDTLGSYYEDCLENPLPIKECITAQTCDMFQNMRAMAIGALFFAALLLLVIVIFTIFLGCIIGRRMMDSPEGQALYRRMQDDSNLHQNIVTEKEEVKFEEPKAAEDVNPANKNANNANNNDGGNINNNNREEEREDDDDDSLDYGGKGLVFLKFPKPLPR